MVEVQGVTYGVVGAGRSGLAVTRLLKSEGESVFLSDAGNLHEHPEVIDELRELGVNFESGGHTARLLEVDTIVLSPGVPPDIPILTQARERGVAITNEIEIAVRRCRGRIIAITGTNGKTTTTELIGHICRTAERGTFVAGNVGTPFSSIVKDVNEGDMVVLELSSFQLERIESMHPEVSLLLNVTPDHMDRYHSIEEYGGAKMRITRNMNESDSIVYNIDDSWLSRIDGMEFRSRRLPFSLRDRVRSDDGMRSGAGVEDGVLVISLDGKKVEEVIQVDRIGIAGPHNLMNSMAAALAARAVGIDCQTIAAGLESFRPLPHRMEEVGRINGVRYINDSKGTNTDALRFALQSYSDPVILIAGGRSKKNEYESLLPLIQSKVKVAVVIGEAADEMEEVFGHLVRTINAGSDFERAVEIAAAEGKNGDVVLLSPACSSFDMFRNFEHRGDVFRSIVQGMVR